MHLLLFSILLLGCLPLRGNGLEDQEFYVLPMRDLKIDRDALATYAPGGSLIARDIEGYPDFEFSWERSAISLTLITNDPADLQKHYGHFLGQIDPKVRPDVEKAFNAKMRIKVVTERGLSVTPIQSARQIIICDKLHQLGGGFLLSPGGLYHLDGRPVRGTQKATNNYFFSFSAP